MRKVRVYLVDDHPVIREGIRRLLELDERIQVVGDTDNGEEAVSQVVATSAEVVLMDVQLPGMDGVETTKQLTDRHPDLRVVILSSFGDRYLAQSMEAGACGYILKTATLPEMISAVLRAADGQSPIDPRLTRMLFSGNAGQSKKVKRQGLSSRQQEILRLIAEGVPSKEIAARLSMSDATLTRELRRSFDILGVDDRAHAIAQAYKEELL